MENFDFFFPEVVSIKILFNMDLLTVFTNNSRRNSFNLESRPSISISDDGSISLSPRNSIGNYESIELPKGSRGSRQSLSVPHSTPGSRRNSHNKSPRPSLTPKLSLSPRPSLTVSPPDSRLSPSSSVSARSESSRHGSHQKLSPRPSITISYDGSIVTTPCSSISNTCASSRDEGSPLLRGSYLSLNVPNSEAGSERRRSSVLALRDALMEAEKANILSTGNSFP